MRKLTVCARDCYDSCSMVFHFDPLGNLQKVTGDTQHPVTKGFLCKRGHAEIKRIFCNRIRQPHIKRNGKLVPVSWDEAMDLVARKIKQTIDTHGSKSILYLTYDGNAGLIHNQFVHRIWHRLKVSLTDMAICTTTGHTILEKHFGLSNGIRPSCLPEKKLIVFWGMNAAVTGPHIWAKAIEARRNGAKIITIDPLRTVTAKHSDLFLQPEPGTDPALALFVINYLIKNNAYDKNFIKQYTTGFEVLAKEAEKWTLEKTSAFTGIPENLLTSLAQSYATIKPQATMIGVALQKRDFGWESVRAIAFIPTVLGYHRGFFYSNGRSYYIDYDYITGAKFGATPNIIPQVATSQHIKNGDVKLIFNSSMNPAQTLTNTKDFVKGIEENNVFLITVDSHWSRTAKMSDVVLPAPTFAEKPDVIISWGHCYTRFSAPVMEPLFESRPETEIMRDLARRLGLKDDFLFEDPVKAIQKAMQQAFADGATLDLTGKIQRLRTKPLNYYPTPDGKIRFALPEQEARELNISPVARQPEHPVSGSGSFILLSTAVPDYTNSQFTEVFGKPAPLLHINNADASKLDIKDGDLIEAGNSSARVKLKAKISDLVPQGVVWFPRAIDDLDGQPVNNLITSEYQRLGRGPKYHSTRVFIKKI